MTKFKSNRMWSRSLGMALLCAASVPSRILDDAVPSGPGRHFAAIGPGSTSVRLNTSRESAFD